MEELLPALEVETAANAKFSVIWLHGLGADGSDFVPVIPMLGLPAEPGVRFIFPHAPMMPVTCNAGYVMRAWYDIVDFDGMQRQVDESGIRDSREAIRRLIARENRRGVPARNIFVAGFSQGGAIAYTTGLTHPERLAGIIALSTYIPLPDLLAADFDEANRDLPVFAAHGDEDEVVPHPLGLQARDLLRLYTRCASWTTYPIPHSVSEAELTDIGAWLRTVLIGGAVAKP
jgi:phospholipase/carboxylesterase